MDSTISALTELGLTETEAALYHAGLSAAASSATELARRTRIKRPTTYHALETLMGKGLVSRKRVGGRVVFAMTPPEGLGAMLDRRAEEIAHRKASLGSVVALLRGRVRPADELTDVSHFVGPEGVKQAVEEALYCRSGRWDIIAPRKNFFSEGDASYAEYFMTTRRRRRIVSRTLWEHASKTRRPLSPEDLRLRQPRYLPDAVAGRLSSTLILFDDNVLILASTNDPSAVLIRSKEIRGTMEALFEGLWEISRPYGQS